MMSGRTQSINRAPRNSYRICSRGETHSIRQQHLHPGIIREACPAKTSSSLLTSYSPTLARPAFESVTANQAWFKVWRTIDGEGDAPNSALELEVPARGVFERQRFLDLLHHSECRIIPSGA